MNHQIKVSVHFIQECIDLLILLSTEKRIQPTRELHLREVLLLTLKEAHQDISAQVAVGVWSVRKCAIKTTLE